MQTKNVKIDHFNEQMKLTNQKLKPAETKNTKYLTENSGYKVYFNLYRNREIYYQFFLF